MAEPWQDRFWEPNEDELTSIRYLRGQSSGQVLLRWLDILRQGAFSLWIQGDANDAAENGRAQGKCSAYEEIMDLLLAEAPEEEEEET